MKKYKYSFILVLITNIIVSANTTLNFIKPKTGGQTEENFLKHLKDTFKTNIFVETGTGGGATTRKAARMFDMVYTIELLEYPLLQYFQDIKNFSNIKSFLGDSKLILPKIISQLKDKRCLFFLDAHCCEKEGAKNIENTPIFSEINTITQNCPYGIILIDDLRFFQKKEIIELQVKKSGNKSIIGYPSLAEIKNLITKNTKHNYKFIVYGDLGLIYNKEIYSNIHPSEVLKAMTYSRLYEEENSSLTIEKVLNQEKAFMNLNDNEYQALKRLIHPSSGFINLDIYAGHYFLWNAIAKIGKNQIIEAQKLLQKIPKEAPISNSHKKPYLNVCKKITRNHIKKFNQNTKKIHFPLNTKDACLSSYPYITGATIRDRTKFKLDCISSFSPKDVLTGDTIFVMFDYLDNFFKEIHPKIENSYILITHHFYGTSDMSIPGKFDKYLDDIKLFAWFTHNPDRIHPKIKPLPLGIGNRAYSYGKKEIFDQSIKKISLKQKESLLYLNFTTHTPSQVEYRKEREMVYSKFFSKPFCYVNKKVTLDKYLTDIEKCKFVLSPIGNGIDTFRTWETLLMKSFPIVKRISSLEPLYKNLPVVVIDNWDQVTEDFLNKKYLELKNKKYKWQKLYMPYWDRKIKKYQALCKKRK